MDVQQARETLARIIERAECFPGIELDNELGIGGLASGLLAHPDLFEGAAGFLEGLLILRMDGDERPFDRLALEVLRRMGVS